MDSRGIHRRFISACYKTTNKGDLDKVGELLESLERYVNITRET